MYYEMTCIFSVWGDHFLPAGSRMLIFNSDPRLEVASLDLLVTVICSWRNPTNFPYGFLLYHCQIAILPHLSRSRMLKEGNGESICRFPWGPHGSPKSWMVSMENPIYKWMMTRGIPVTSGTCKYIIITNHHDIIFTCIYICTCI